MRRALIAAICLYQRLAPTALRQRCIFECSCSDHVLDGARHGGIPLALARLRQRMRCCRPGYRAVSFTDAGRLHHAVLLRDGSTVPASALNARTRRSLGLPD